MKLYEKPSRKPICHLCGKSDYTLLILKNFEAPVFVCKRCGNHFRSQACEYTWKVIDIIENGGYEKACKLCMRESFSVR